MQKSRTDKPLRKENVAGVDRLQRYIGVRKVSYYYLYPDGTSETLASAKTGDRQAIAEAERVAKRKALDIREGVIVVGSVAGMIDRFKTDIAPTHYLDQSKDGLAVRESGYKNLTAFFGRMNPHSLKMVHGYQYLDDRARVGAPLKANKEMALMSTICNYCVRWGVLEQNPFVGMMQNKKDRDVRTTSRRQVLRFYLWSLRQQQSFRILGCASMFTYLTGFRAAEVRPFHINGLSNDGVRVLAAKRKKGEAEVMKLREWSIRLRTVVERAKLTHKVERLYLFSNLTGKPYSRSGWGSVWNDAMFEWIASFDPEAAKALALKKAWDAAYKVAYDQGKSIQKPDFEFKLIKHPAYFSLLDVRPAAITTKLRNRSVDAYDFAAHANPSTTHKNYDRRKEKRARATE